MAGSFELLDPKLFTLNLGSEKTLKLAPKANLEIETFKSFTEQRSSCRFQLLSQELKKERNTHS